MHPARGSCLCGAVRYVLTRPFLRANLCHCTRCQKHSGAAASAQGRVPREGFELLAGAEKLTVFRPPGGGMAKVFCAVCGSSLFGGQWPDGEEVSVRLGCLDGPPSTGPQFHSYDADRPVWDPALEDGLPRFAGPPGARP